MAKHSKFRTRDSAVLATVFTVGLGLSSHEVINEFGSPDTLLDHCTFAETPNTGDSYQQEVATRLLNVEPANASNVKYLGAACFTLIDQTKLQDGVDVGPRAFGPREPYEFYEDCVAFLSDEKLVPSDGLRRTQVVIACEGLHYARNA
jgi:hypothetical protein